MISESCDLDGFIESIKDLRYHEVLTSILKEGYEADDLLVSRRREEAAAPELEKIREYSRALRFFVFLLQTGERPDLVTEREREEYQKFRQVAESLVERGELLSGILEHFDV